MCHSEGYPAPIEQVHIFFTRERESASLTRSNHKFKHALLLEEKGEFTLSIKRSLLFINMSYFVVLRSEDVL